MIGQNLKAKLKSRQHGAVAIIVALSLVALVRMLGLVLDLGYLYINKTGLQNAADAAALSGAERLDGTLCSVNSNLAGCDVTKKGAVQYAIETAGKNNYGFNKIQVDIDITDIYLGNCPSRLRFGATDSDGCAMVRADTVDNAAEAVGLTFLQVDTRDRMLNTWFAKIWNILQTQTYAMAVAGRYVTQILPVAVCALDPNNSSQYVSENGTWPKFLAEYGFRRGTSYELGSINIAKGAPPGIMAGTQLYIHPTAQTQSECQGNPANNDDMMPYICGGKSALSGAVGSVVYSNTGLQSGKSKDAFNTRFLTNTVSGCEGVGTDSDLTDFTPNYAGAAVATKWMNYTNDDRAPTQSVIVDLAARLADPSLNSPVFTQPSGPPNSRGILERAENNDGETGGCSGDCGDNYGVLWSNYRPLKKLSATADPVDALPADWPSLYRGGATHIGATWTKKYTGNGRRIINTLIVNCSAITGGGVCQPIPVLGVGEFLLQTDVNTVSGTNIYGEFGRLITLPLPSAEQIRLYR